MGNSAPQKQSQNNPSENAPNNNKCVFHPQLYQGTWYELARYTNPYEKDCVSASQTLKWNQKEQKMSITNKCVSSDGNTLKIKGVGVPSSNHACQMTVTFKGVAKTGQYWIIWTDYDKWSLVGNENKTAFWMLSRMPYISKDDYRLLKVYAMTAGYNGNLIIPRNVIAAYKIETEGQEGNSELIDESKVDESSCTDFNSDFKS